MSSPLWQLPPFDTTAWHPRLSALWQCWQSLPRRDGVVPSRADFDPLMVPQSLASLWLLDVERTPFRVRYRLVGTNVVRALGGEPTGRYLDEIRPDTWHAPGVCDRLLQAVEERVASYGLMTPRMNIEAPWTKIESLVLPFASDHHSVDLLMGGSVFHRVNGRVL
jgi:hypothetical protein